MSVENMKEQQVTNTFPKILIGFCSCLPGDQCRYITDNLGKYAEFYSLCPDSELGHKIPGESVCLMRHLLSEKSSKKSTGQKLSLQSGKSTDLKELPLCGFIFKSPSRSTGMERVKVYSESSGTTHKNRTGILSDLLINSFPYIPAADETSLNDPVIRENFMDRIFAYARWLEMMQNRRTSSDFLRFHERHKLTLMAHSPSHYREAGRITGNLKAKDLDSALAEYLNIFTSAMKMKATVGKNHNVLQHVFGYFKKNLSSEEKDTVAHIFNDYRQKLIPLIVPVTIMNFFVKKFNSLYLSEQYYLNPFPAELKLRNYT